MPEHLPSYWVVPPLMILCLAASAHVMAEERPKIDPELRPYKKVSGVSGTLNSIGSDTLNNLMTLWAERFQRQYPGIKIQVEGKGSNTAPPALIEGTAQLGPMSRKMTGSEADKFEARFGYKPTGFPVAIDALALYVNKDNPLRGLTMEQVGVIFSKSRRDGRKENIATWGQLGLTGDWAHAPISLYGRNSTSGTYVFFKERVLKDGNFKDEVKEQPGSASMVQGVTEDRYGLGYSGVGYVTSGVRTLPIATKAGASFVEPSQDNARNGSYPIWRYLYVYVNQAPGQPLSPIVAEFLRYVYSREGQSDVLKDGYFPLNGMLAKQELTKVR